MARKSVPQRPLTVREIQAEKDKQKSGANVTILNISRQLIPIHLMPPKGVDFYFGAQDIRLGPGMTHKFDKKRLWSTQIDRLQKQKKIQVIHDSEKQAKAM